MIGAVMAIVGLGLLLAWRLVWTGRWTLRPGTPRTTRFLLGVWPGLAFLVMAIGMAAAGSEFSLADGHPVMLVAGVLLFVGLAVVVAGLGWATLALVRTPRRFDAEWLRKDSPARAEALREDPGDRLRRDRRNMAIIGAIFSAFGVVIAINGARTDDRGILWLGVVSLVFFGGSALVYLRLTTPRRRFEPPEIGPVPGAQERGMLFPVSRSSMAVFAVGAAVFVAAGIAFVVDPAMWIMPRLFDGNPTIQTAVRAVGLVAVAFFGMVLVLSTHDAVRPFGLALTPHRVLYRAGAGRFSVLWDDIASVILGSHGDQPTLGLRATDLDALHLRGLLRVFSPIRRRWLESDVWISLRTLRCDPTVIATVVTHLVDHPDDRELLTDARAPELLDMLSPSSPERH